MEMASDDKEDFLSRVELVLPKNVLESCYHLKVGLTACFRAVNKEDRTTSDIILFKQFDESVKITVFVTALVTNATHEADQSVTKNIQKDASEARVSQNQLKVLPPGKDQSAVTQLHTKAAVQNAKANEEERKSISNVAQQGEHPAPGVLHKIVEKQADDQSKIKQNLVDKVGDNLENTTGIDENQEREICSVLEVPPVASEVEIDDKNQESVVITLEEKENEGTTVTIEGGQLLQNGSIGSGVEGQKERQIVRKFPQTNTIKKYPPTILKKDHLKYRSKGKRVTWKELQGSKNSLKWTQLRTRTGQRIHGALKKVRYAGDGSIAEISEVSQQNGGSDDGPDGSGKQNSGITRASTNRAAGVGQGQSGGSSVSDPNKPRKKRPYVREHKIKCKWCDTMVKDYGYLFRHVKKLHPQHENLSEYLEEIRPLMRTPCPICNKMVSSISNISSHIKQCHSEQTVPVNCSHCDKKYKNTLSLRQHIRQCHQPENRVYLCHLCKVKFTERRSLQEHINCSHEQTTQYACEECGKTFLTKGRLRRHKFIHGDYRHNCPHCGKGFHLKDNMYKHIKIVHEKPGMKEFKCQHCGRGFNVRCNLTQHIMGVHLKKFPHNCPVCDMGFRRRRKLLEHMEFHRKGGLADGMEGKEQSDELMESLVELVETKKEEKSEEEWLADMLRDALDDDAGAEGKATAKGDNQENTEADGEENTEADAEEDTEDDKEEAAEGDAEEDVEEDAEEDTQADGEVDVEEEAKIDTEEDTEEEVEVDAEEEAEVDIEEETEEDAEADAEDEADIDADEEAGVEAEEETEEEVVADAGEEEADASASEAESDVSAETDNENSEADTKDTSTKMQTRKSLKEKA